MKRVLRLKSKLLDRDNWQVERFALLVGDLDHLHLAEIVDDGAASSGWPSVDCFSE